MQDSKNLILAIVLCMAIVFGWSYLAQYMGWAPKQDPKQIEEIQRQQAEAAVKQKLGEEAAAKLAANPLPVFQEAEGKDISIQTPLYAAKLYTGGGIFRSFELTKFRSSVEKDAVQVNLVNPLSASMAPLGLLVNGQPSWSVGKWSAEKVEDLNLQEGQGQGVVLRGQIGNIVITRHLFFDASSYYIKEEIKVRTADTAPASVRLGYTIGADTSNAQGGNYDSMRVGWDDNGSLKEESDADKLKTGVLATGKIQWAAAMSTYFMNGVLPQSQDPVTFKGVLQNGVYRVAVEETPFVVEPGQEKVFKVGYWLGPKDRKLMTPVSEELSKSVDLGMFSLIAKGLLWILDFFYNYVGNWGLAIICLTIVIKALFWPLTAKSYDSMEKMKKLAPMMEKLKAKYKDDKEAMNKEVMALYKTYGVNPASGCVPILIQMPVFFGLYQALLTSVELRHASFIQTLPFTDMPWLLDLSAKDPYYITPIIMGLTMLIQQRLSPQTGTGMQQKMMLLLPIVFTFLFLTFPSGLVIYWLVNNVLSIAQQWMMIKRQKKPAVAKNQQKPAATKKK